MRRAHPTTIPAPYNQAQWNEIEVHPIFWRILKDNPHFLPTGKEINFMWDMIWDKIPNKETKYPTSEHKKKLWKQFRSIYSMVDDLFSSSLRSDETPYFYHLLETAFILTEESSLDSLNIEDIFVALLHDIIEDTPHDYHSLWKALSHKWKEIAFWVHIISKTSFDTYIDNEEEKKVFEQCFELIWEENLDLSWKIIDDTLLPPDVVEKYNFLKGKYKSIRNTKHFEKYLDFDTFYEYSKWEANKLQIKYSEEWLKKICLRSINVKLADRLHNLKTLWHMSEEKVLKKLRETRIFILPIAEEVNPIMAEKIRSEITKLEWTIIKNMFKTVSYSVKGMAEWLIA